MNSDTVKDTVIQYFNNPSKGLSLRKTINSLKNDNVPISSKEVKQILGDYGEYQKNKKTSTKGKFLHIIAKDEGSYQLDLMFLDEKYKKFNKGYNIFLVFINVPT